MNNFKTGIKTQVIKYWAMLTNDLINLVTGHWRTTHFYTLVMDAVMSLTRFDNLHVND